LRLCSLASLREIKNQLLLRRIMEERYRPLHLFYVVLAVGQDTWWTENTKFPSVEL